MKRTLAAVVVTVGVMVVAGYAMAASMAKSGSFERTVTIKAPGASAVETEKFCWEGDRLRAEKFTIAGQMVQIKSGRTLYMYNPKANEALKATLPEKYARSVQQMLADEAGSAKGGKKVGAGKISGIACDVYMLSKKSGGVTRTVKAYMSKDARLPIPLRVEIAMGKTTQIIDTKNIKLNMNVPDSMFSLPKGAKVKEQKVQVAPAPKAPSKK